MAYYIPDDLSIPPFLRRGPGNTLPKVAPMSTRGVPVGQPFNPGAGLPVPYQGGGLPAANSQAPFFDPLSGLPMGGSSKAPFTLGLNGLHFNGTGTDLVPSNGNMPATKDLGSMLSGGLLSRLGSLLGPMGGGLIGLLTSATPAGDANDNGSQIPLPQPRPNMFGDGASVPDNPFVGASVPMPTPRPPLSLAPPAPGPSSSYGAPNPFAPAPMGGPGSMSFGAGDGPSGNNFGLGNASDILRKLFGGGAGISGGAIY